MDTSDIQSKLEPRDRHMPDKMQNLYIHSMTREARDVLRLELRSCNGGDLAGFSAGAHINLNLGINVSRSYSLINNPSERDRYLIAVQKELEGRGGSRWLHETARVGMPVQCSFPRNNFPLNENAKSTLFIAGGIGITPIWSMIQQLEALNRGWELHYRVRSRDRAPLIAELSSKDRTGAVNVSFGDEVHRDDFSLESIVGAAPSDAEFYCCGPTDMLKAFEKATEQIESSRIHLERFSADTEGAVNQGFVVRAVKSGVELEVAEGQTILEVLRDAGVDAPYSCEAGLCGECQTRVISGAPEHRDMFLTEDEKKSGDCIMICCSGSRSPILELDL